MYKSVYPQMAKQFDWTVEETDALMKEKFLSLGRYTRSKSDLTMSELREFAELVIAYGMSLGCVFKFKKDGGTE